MTNYAYKERHGVYSQGDYIRIYEKDILVCSYNKITGTFVKGATLPNAVRIAAKLKSL